MNGNNVIYYDRSGVEHILKEIKKFKGKNLLDNTSLFRPNKHEKNDEIMLKYFQWLKTKNLYIVLSAIIVENLKAL